MMKSQDSVREYISIYEKTKALFTTDKYYSLSWIISEMKERHEITKKNLVMDALIEMEHDKLLKTTQVFMHGGYYVRQVAFECYAKNW